ncbi:hypothetical protein D3C86_2007190 [compost metagenome]
MGWRDQYTLDHLRRAFIGQRTDQRLANPQFGQYRQGIERRVRPETLGHGAQGFLLLGRECAQTVLDAQPQLSQHVIRQVTRRLGDEIHAHAF